MADQPCKTFPLLDLPAELILRVLNFTILRSSHQTPIELDIVRFYILGLHDLEPSTLDEKWLPTDLKQPAIARTCRLLRGERLKLYYAHNVFFLGCGGRYSHRRLKIWLEQIGYTRFPKLAPIHVRWPKFRAFLAELRCLEEEVGDVVVSCSIFLQMRGGKVLLGTGGLERSYQVCFQARPKSYGDEDTWISLEALRNGEIDWNSKFWVVDGQG